MVKTIEGKLAVLVIDVQNEFVDPKGSLYCEGGPDIIPQVNRITEAARKAGAPVIFTQEFHRKEEIDFGRELDGAEPCHCVEGTWGVQLAPKMNVEKNDYVLTKPRYSAFLYTDLAILLNGLGILPGDTLVFCGVAVPLCLTLSTADAHQRDYRVRVVDEATACLPGFTPEEREGMLKTFEYMQEGGRVKMDDMMAAIANYKK